MANKEKEGNGAKVKEGNGANVSGQGSGQKSMTQTANRPMTQTSRAQHPINRLRDQMDLLFDRSFGWPMMSEPELGLGRFWNTDVDEGDKEITVRVEAPGFEPKDFDIQVSGNTLNIWAEHREETEDKEKGYRRWGYGQFQRSIELSSAVDAEKVEAYYRNGILEVRLPRTEPNSNRRIEVKT